MTTLYRIRNWDALYENAASRKLKNLTYVPIQNKHDGKGYRRLLTIQEILPTCQENLPRRWEGLEMFAAWILILQIASKCPKRGTLADEDGPLTSEDMSFKTGAPEGLFECTLNVLSGNDFRWIEKIDLPECQENLPTCQENDLNVQARTEQNRTVSLWGEDHEEDHPKQNQSSKKKFVPPSFDEVLAYSKEKDREDLAKQFFDYFEAGNWIDSKGCKVRSWKQKFITWMSRNDKPAGAAPAPQETKPTVY